jgi:hypothetical protein
MHFKLIVKNKATGEESLCDGEFTAEEWEILSDFRKCSEAISSAAMFQNGWKSSPLGWSKETGWWSDDKTPDSHVREILHLLRPVILQDETTNYSRVINLLYRKMDKDGIRTILNRWKDGFFQKVSQSYFTLVANELVLNSDKAFSLWLNAFEYHRDKDKKAELEKALGDLPFNVAKNVFINGIVEKVDAVSRLAKFIWDIGHGKPGDSVGLLGGKQFS